MSTSAPITPYTGPMTVHAPAKGMPLEQAAAITSDAAVKFSQVFPETLRGGSESNRIQKGANPLDEATATSLNDLRAQMRSTPPKHATVINLNPFTLDFGMGNLYLRSIVIPACVPGMPYAKGVIRHWRHESMYNEDGSRFFKAILPIKMAGEFVREFSMKDNYGGGVLICEGDINPEKCGPDFLVETYDAHGRPVTFTQRGVEYDGEQAIEVELQTPIKRPLHKLIEEVRKARNVFYRRTVAIAERDWNLPDGRGKQNVNDTHRQMAELLVAEGERAKLPDFCTSADKSGLGLSDTNCRACGTTPKIGAYKCAECGNILNALEAYKDFAIEFEHAKMAMLTSDEMEEAELIKMEREDARKPKTKKEAKEKGEKA